MQLVIGTPIYVYNEYINGKLVKLQCKTLAYYCGKELIRNTDTLYYIRYTRFESDSIHLTDNLELVSQDDNLLLENHFKSVMNYILNDINQNAVNHKFWENHNPKSIDELNRRIMLIASECFEIFDALRKDSLDYCSNHIPEFSYLEEELADIFIRTLDTAVGYNCRLTEAIIAKMKFNVTRPIKHGKIF